MKISTPVAAIRKRAFCWRRNGLVGNDNQRRLYRHRALAGQQVASVSVAVSNSQIYPSTNCTRRNFGLSAADIPANLVPSGVKIELDFFGEPVTFLGIKPTDKVSNAMAAMDGFLLAAITKGRTCALGGDEAGIFMKAPHSVAVSWAEALRFATFWNQPAPVSTNEDESIENMKSHKSAPMLAVVAVAPLLAHTGLSYAKHLDSLLKQTRPPVPGFPEVQMLDLARNAVDRLDEPFLNTREKMHLHVLKNLLEENHQHALIEVLHILRLCPGDALALSLAMDLANTLGDREAACQAAGSVISYWHERRGGLVRPAIPGHAIALSLIALGFAVGGHIPEAERIAEAAMQKGRKVCGALATWAQTHVFDAGGRVSEAISALANTDGIDNYEGAGFLFFDCRLSGYGARFAMDREERGRGISAALRLYGNYCERLLDYSGFATRQPWSQPVLKAPISWSSRRVLTQGEEAELSFMDRLTGKSEKQKRLEQQMEMHYEVAMKQDELPSRRLEAWDPSNEDVLTWLPPTPIMLAETTLLLFRLTLNGTVSSKNFRWDDMRNSWEAFFDIHKRYSDEPLRFSPIVSLSASILMPPSETGGDEIGSGSLARGLNLMGQLMKLGKPKFKDDDEEEDSDSGSAVGEVREFFEMREVIARTDPSLWYPKSDGTEDEWKKVVLDLVAAKDGFDPDDDSISFGSGRGNDGAKSHFDDDVSRLRFSGWTFDTRPIIEHAIVFAACKSGDIESLSAARSICSRGVMLRPASPEEWWRYSIVLGLLGDEVASEEAWVASMHAGGGQGAQH
ncbi:hypothetical protein ACA910_012840 [Epithemia clementina (nom. ined.)]